MKLGLAIALVSFLSVAAPTPKPRVANVHEKIPANEPAVIEALNAATVAAVKHHRDAHAKGHGCVDDVDVTILDNLPKDFKKGFFAESNLTRKAMIRFSNGSGIPNVDDRQGGGQGFALKIFLNEEEKSKLLKVHGEQRFVEDKYYDTFDILMISSGVREFFTETAADYGPFFAAKGAAEAAVGQAIKGGTPPEQAGLLAQAVMAKMYLFPEGLEPRTREAGLLARLGSSKPVFPLNESYNSFVPSLLGKRAVKYEVRPCEAKKNEELLSELPQDLKDGMKTDLNFLRANLQWQLENKAHCYELWVQMHTYGHPTIEDAAAKWNTKVKDYVKVARIDIPKKTAPSLTDEDLCETLSFHPGHASEAHYPIGGVQRARVGYSLLNDDRSVTHHKGIYTVIANQRNLNRGKTALKEITVDPILP